MQLALKNVYYLIKTMMTCHQIFIFKLTQVREPLLTTMFQLIDISHKPGRRIILPENKEEVKKQTKSGVETASNSFYKAGINRFSIIKNNFKSN